MHRFMFAILMGWVPLASAYVTPNGDRTRWRQMPQPGIARLCSDLPADQCRAALQGALATWTEVEGAPLALRMPVDGPADLTIGFVSDRPDLVGVLGVTLTTTEGIGADRAIVHAEVLLNDDFEWSIDGPRGTFGVQATATHEIGHALGLGHSADRTATMYWHYDANGVALGDDDRRGLRFLYGQPVGAGRSCDQCTVAADCAGGLCLQRFNEGDRAFCARACAAGCSADEICVGLVAGGDGCVPALGFCGDGGGLPQGAHCWGPFQCAAPNRCVVFPGGAQCSAPCDGPGFCQAGRVCALDPVDLPRSCLPPGRAELGEPCGWATACASGVCLPSGVCSRWCADGCPAGWRCAADAHWADAPQVCHVAPVDLGIVDAGAPDGAGLDATVEADAAMDAATPSAVDARVDAPADAPDVAFTDSAHAADAHPADSGSGEPPAPPTDSGCAQLPHQPSTWWLGWALVLCGRRRRLR